MQPLSLEQTEMLWEILERKDWGLLEEVIVVHGYDESEWKDQEYEIVEVHYPYRKITHR